MWGLNEMKHKKIVHILTITSSLQKQIADHNAYVSLISSERKPQRWSSFNDIIDEFIIQHIRALRYLSVIRKLACILRLRNQYKTDSAWI